MIYANRAWLAHGWAKKVRLRYENGIITGIQCASLAQASDVQVDTLLPALSNLHSHSFQRAMAGMTEFKKAKTDSFWTWRKLMYQFLEKLDMPQLESFIIFIIKMGEPRMMMLWNCLGEYYQQLKKQE